MQEKRKILMAMDGSAQSLAAATYIGQVLAKHFGVVLFHVEAEVPEAYRDIGAGLVFDREEYPLGIWKVHQHEMINNFMEKACGILTDAGFGSEAVQTKIEPMRSGIARDIYNESQRDYCALVLGRTGNNKLDDIMMGSVATKLVDVTHHIPVIVVGGHPQGRKILLGFDGSRGATKALSCIGDFLEPTVCDVILCHVIRPLNPNQLKSSEVFIRKHETLWIEANKRRMVPALKEASERLVVSGFAPERITSQILTYETSRAAALARAARSNGCDSIVLGRRGVTSVENFMIGRVSRKLLHLAYDMVLWIVS